MSLPWDSTNWAMIVSTSGKGDPAKINFKMLRTESLEKSPVPFCAGSTLASSSKEDCVDGFIGPPCHSTELPRKESAFPGADPCFRAASPVLANHSASHEQ
jgi:hypothetical protein